MEKQAEQDAKKQFDVDMATLQTMFDTDNLQSGKSIEILNSLG